MPQQNGTPGPDILIGTWGADLLSGKGGNDRLVGDRGTDALLGDAGNDILWGGLDGDTLDGGAGFDYAVYQSSATGVIVGLNGAAGIEGEAEGDTLLNIEGLVGSDFDDTLTGNMANNVFRGGQGADRIDGGLGHDRASYAYSSAGVEIDLLRAAPQLGGDAEGDVLISIERVTGSAHDDHISGDEKDNEFSGGAGADYLDGRAGNDFADYRGSTAIDIDLTRQFQIGGHAEGDQLANIESIRGSTGNDRIVGDAGRNHLIGDAGDDYIDIGTAGATRITDRADGGIGNDTIVVNMNNNTFANVLGGAGEDTLILRYQERVPDSYMPQTPTTAYFGYTYATGFEHVEAYGSSANDLLYGMSGTTDKLMGGDGNDTIRGGIGDYLDGGSGYDWAQLDYGEGYAADVTVNLAAGTATGLAGLVSFEELSLVTGIGDDTLISGANRTNVITGAGDDHVTVAGTFNSVTVGTGTADFDTVIGGNGTEAVTIGDRGHVDGGGGAFDSLWVTFASDTGIVFEVDSNGNGGSNTGLTVLNVERFFLNTGGHDDIIRTTNGDDRIQSGGGDDLIETFGNDGELSAGAGNDILDGGAGHDIMSGGTGADRFHFSEGDDRVTDFNAADGDIIVISQAWQSPDQDTYAELMANAEEMSGGLLLHGTNGTSTMLLSGVTKATFTESSVEFLT